MNRMNSYINWNEVQIDPTSDAEINALYDQGYVFVRIGKNILQQTRSVRIKLADFTLSSENRRVLRKVENLSLELIKLPISPDNYDWHIHKLGKDFYNNKFGPGIFTASRIKTILTTQELNFNFLLKYSIIDQNCGYAIAYSNSSIMHYAYPFYDFEAYPSNLGMAMMIQAILYAQNEGREYIYLGSVRKASDIYKLQFKGVEYYQKDQWSNDIAALKQEVFETPSI